MLSEINVIHNLQLFVNELETCAQTDNTEATLVDVKVSAVSLIYDICVCLGVKPNKVLQQKYLEILGY